MKRLMSVSLLALALFFSVPAVTYAHVTVQPGVSTTGAYEKYTVRVPVEKKVNTTEVKLKIPKEVRVVSVMPVPEWDYSLDRKDGRVASITWTAAKGGIGEHEFMEFSFVGANPDKPGEVAWKAIQTYEDDSEVRWVGEPSDKEPASITVIEQGEGHSHGHDDQEAKNEETEEQPSAVDEEEEPTAATGENGWPMGLAGLALLLSMIALFRKR
ncbi:YcnI family copper-binding membrane protein [Desmospora profundinema]|uniref:Uncharacterized protein YcnI n=1 Tax=Desmospora profundinema TaxID=1571184 RepID=A0ABU1IMH4_9BACL|nr:YcnI family protein [Desmospora profundinema]MDR6225975.1 uncharacterized protein YcnI [Desmospora profundinema]